MSDMMHSYEAGKNTFIKTFGEYYTGHIVRITLTDIVLKKAAWVASTGRFAGAMASGEFDEVEPYPDDMEIAVPFSAIQSGVPNWPHELPREQK